MPTSSPVFDLPPHLIRKSDPALIADDERHLVAVAAALADQIAALTTRLEDRRREAGRAGQGALERDLDVHRLAARLRTLRRFGVDLCLGRMVPDGGGAPVYVGRLGLVDASGERLLVDWRSPAAEPFFGATLADPRGLASRRRYRWARERITDYWDETFSLESSAGADGRSGSDAALDDTSAFIAGLGASRTARMRDVLGTIAADQDAIVRAGADGALVVDGGPGTGKTVVALHRAAYLLYAEPVFEQRRGGVLVIGPHQPYLDYVADVLPGLGEDGVRTAALRDLVPQGADATVEQDAGVARLKARSAVVAAIEPAVALYEEPPREGMEVETPWADLWLSSADWAEAFAAPEAGTPHNEAREVVWEALVAVLADKLADAVGSGSAESDDGPVPDAALRHALRGSDVARALARAWPMLEATDVVGDLWTVPAYLERCAPSLTPDEVRALQRTQPQAWTTADLPLLDAARRRLGDAQAAGRRRAAQAATAADRDYREQVVADLVAADDSELMIMSMLRGDDLRNAMDDDAHPGASVHRDELAGPFAHVVVDEAQELTDAEWSMVLARCPSRSLTIVGDRAQARHPFVGTWRERLARLGLTRVREAGLRVNYRTPSEVMAAAEPVIRAAVPDASVPTSVRSSGVPVRFGELGELGDVVAAWLQANGDGVACVIRAGGGGTAGVPDVPEHPRVRMLTPELAKGLEFDLVVLVADGSDDDGGGDAVSAVDRYVAMTRATQELVVLTAS